MSNLLAHNNVGLLVGSWNTMTQQLISGARDNDPSLISSLFYTPQKTDRFDHPNCKKNGWIGAVSDQYCVMHISVIRAESRPSLRSRANHAATLEADIQATLKLYFPSALRRSGQSPF